MPKIILLLYSFINLVGCADGKTCEQSVQDLVSIENRTGIPLNIAVSVSTIMSGTISSQVQLADAEVKENFVIHESVFTREGQPRKIGPRYDAICTAEAEKHVGILYLNANSFAQFKNCYDNENHRSILVNLIDTCPTNTIEQKSPVD